MSEITKSVIDESETMNIIDFIELLSKTFKYKKDWQPLKIKKYFDDDGKLIKKDPEYINGLKLNLGNGFMPKTNDFTNPDITIKEFNRRKKFIIHCDYIAINTNIIHQIDIDDVNINEEYKNKLINNNPYFLSLGKKLPHIFTIITDIPSSVSTKFDIDVNKNGKNNEALIGQWAWCHKDTIVYNAKNQINKISYKDINMVPRCNSFTEAMPTLVFNKETEEKIPIFNIKNLDEKTIIDCLSKLSQDRVDNYNDWINVGMIIKNSGCDKDIWIEWSKQSNKFDLEVCNNKWNGFSNESTGGLTLGTLIHYSKEDTKDELEELLYLSISNSDYDIAKVIHYFVNKNYVAINTQKQGSYLYYNGINWEYDLEGINLTKFLTTKLVDVYNEFIMKLNKKFQITEDKIEREKIEKRIQRCRKVISSLKTTKSQQNILKQCSILLFDKDFEDTLETKWDLFAFNDKVLNITINDFVVSKPEYKINMTTGYAFRKATKEEIEHLDNVINTIFPDPEEKKAYLMFLSTSLEGRTIENFAVCCGAGGNGKSYLTELLMTMLGHYGVEGSVDTLMKPIGDGPNPTLSNLDKKRFGYWNEPPAGKNFSSGTICKLTGGSTICARGLYSGNTKTKINLTMLIECMKQPPIDEISSGIQRRLLDIPFRSDFVKQQKYDELKKKDLLNNTTFLANTELKNDEYKNKYKFALFEILRKHYVMYRENNYNLIIPDSIIKRNLRYLEKSDDFYNWFETKYKITEDKNDFVSIKDLYNCYIESEYLTMSSKRDKKKSLNDSNFKDTIKNHTILRKYHCDSKMVYIDKKRTCRKNILVYVKRREEIEEDESEDEDKYVKLLG